MNTKENTLLITEKRYRNIFCHEGEYYVNRFLHEIHDLAKSQLLKEMRTGIPPKIDDLLFSYQKKKQIGNEWEPRAQSFGLRFFDDGTVCCADKHKSPEAPWAPSMLKRRLYSIGVFEVCDCKLTFL